MLARGDPARCMPACQVQYTISVPSRRIRALLLVTCAATCYCQGGDHHQGGRPCRVRAWRPKAIREKRGQLSSIDVKRPHILDCCSKFKFEVKNSRLRLKVVVKATNQTSQRKDYKPHEHEMMSPYTGYQRRTRKACRCRKE